VSSVGSHPPALDVGGQVLVEVRLTAVEGELSEHARRELIKRNLALLEPVVMSLRRHLAARSSVVCIGGDVVGHLRGHLIDPRSARWWMRARGLTGLHWPHRIMRAARARWKSAAPGGEWHARR
jgi:hypothetical protein